MSDRRPSFNPARAMGIAPRRYEEYFDSEAVPVLPGPNFNPDRGYSTASQAIGRFDSFGNQFGEFEAKNALGALDARKDIVDPNSDILRPEAQDKRMNYMLRGAISPHQASLIESTQRAPAVNKYSPVEPEVVKATTSIDLIDPADENALKTLHQVWTDLDAHPELGSSNIKAHPYLRDAFHDKERAIYAARAHLGTHQKNDASTIAAALKEGAAFDDISPFLDEAGEKIADQRGFLEARAQAARNKSIMSPKIRGKLDELAIKAQESARMEPLPAAKEAWLAAQGITEPTAEDWSRAYHALKYGPMEQYHAFEAQLREQGYKPLGGPQKPQEAPQEAAPAAKAVQPQSSTQPARTPNDGAIALLREHPDLAPQFEAMYGHGAAAKVLGAP